MHVCAHMHMPQVHHTTGCTQWQPGACGQVGRWDERARDPGVTGGSGGLGPVAEGLLTSLCCLVSGLASVSSGINMHR